MSAAGPLTENYEITPWPIPGDILLSPGTGGEETARVGWGHDQWEIYATGYKGAAEILLKAAVEGQQPSDLLKQPPDLLIYPTVFNCRHYLELRLKEIIVTGQQLLDQMPDLRQVHHLDQLWRDCRKISETVWPNDHKADLDAVEDCIDQFCQFDRQSFGFRYPYTKDGKPSIMNLASIDLRNFAQVFARVSTFLEGISAAISEYLDNRPY